MSVELLLLAALGGMLALDATGLGQVMLSRPLVAGTLAGAVVGDPAGGLVVGVALELLLLSEVPVGGSAVPEGWLGAIAAAAIAPALPETVAGWGAAVLYGLVWALVGGLSLPLLRRWNTHFLPARHHPRPDVALERSHRLALAVDFLRGAGLAAVAAVATGAVGDVAAAEGPSEAGRILTGVGAADAVTLTVAALLATGAGVSAGAVLSRSGRVPRAPLLFLLGACGGAAAVVLL